MGLFYLTTASTRDAIEKPNNQPAADGAGALAGLDRLDLFKSGQPSTIDQLRRSLTPDAKPGDNRFGESFTLPPLFLTGDSALSCKNEKLPAGDHLQHFQLDGKARQYDVHLPKNYDPSKPIPVMYMLHGLTESAAQMKEYSQMNKVADEKGFAVVYVQALPQPFPGTLGVYKENSWNLNNGTLTDKDPTYDDLKYFKEVKARVESQISLDPKKQYLAGFSEGGQASQYIAHEMPNTFAGVASIHGTILDSDPKPRKGDPTAMISVLGDDDNILPISGGHGFGEGGYPMKGWMLTTVSRISESQPLKQATLWAEAGGNKESTVTRSKAQDTTTYSGGDAPVMQIVRKAHKGPDGKSQGGQHAWDGGNDGWKAVPNPDLIQNISKYDRKSDPTFDTSRTIADFLLKFEKPTAKAR